MDDYRNPALPVEQRVSDLLRRMTLEEKAAQTCMMRGQPYATHQTPLHSCSVEPDTDFDWEKLGQLFGTDGVGYVHDMYSTPAVFNRVQRYFIEHSRLGIPVIFTAEALHGITGLRGTVFPIPLNFGATFDPELIHQIGGAIGRETRALGMHEILAPNLDVARELRWGRCEETFGEDTCLSSRMAAAIVSGEQKGDISRPDAVIAEPKHYCVHGIAEGGTNCSPARAGQREVESCYLPVFEAAVCEGGAYDVMASYNSVDGDVMMCSEHYLRDVLKDRMGLRGVVRSDWGGVGRLRTAHHLVSTDKDAICLAVKNGLDVQGCDYEPDFWKQNIVELVREGRLSMERLDDIVSRVLRLKFELGLFEHPYTDETAWEQIIRCDSHRKLALQAARESVTLLKNNGVLPLKKGIRSVALIGPSSDDQKIGGYSSIPQFHIPSVYELLQQALGEQVTVRQCDGCPITTEAGQSHRADGQFHLQNSARAQVQEDMDWAVELAGSCDVIIMVGGDNNITSGEGQDRCELTMSGRQRELVLRLAQLHKPLILVTENGKALELSAESQVCDAVIMSWYGGECGAQAIVEALVGTLNPSGRLPLSLPRSSTRIPCYYSMLPGGQDNFMEGPKNALYPFGYGLSYTSFSYQDLTVEKTGPAQVTVACTVENTGSRDGDEVVQLYVDDVDSSVATPPVLLRDFRRISLRAGQKQRVEFHLDEKAFRLMNLRYEWVVEPGKFRILIGPNSRDLRLEGSVTL